MHIAILHFYAFNFSYKSDRVILYHLYVTAVMLFTAFIVPDHMANKQSWRSQLTIKFVVLLDVTLSSITPDSRCERFPSTA